MPRDQMFDKSQPHTMPAKDEFKAYRRTKLVVDAIRIPGPFTVVTREGPLRCDDGWLALDTAGWPYPIAHAEMVQICDTEAPMTPDAAQHARSGEPVS